MPGDRTDTFKRNNIDRYLARPSVSFCDEKYSILDSFCFTEFTAYYSLIYKPKETKEGEEYQQDLLPDSLMKFNHENLNYPKIIRLMDSNGTMQCRKVHQVFRYHTPNKYRFPKKYTHHLLFLFFFLFRSEKELLGGHFSTYQGKLAEPGVMDIINENQENFEPYSAVVDRAYENLNSEFVDNQDAYGQIENDKTGKPIYNEEDAEPHEQNTQVDESNLALGDFIPKIATDNEIAPDIRNLNKKQRIVFDVLHQWAKDYVKNVSSKKKKHRDYSSSYIFIW